MPTLLPRESMNATSVIPASIQRPSPSDHRVGSSNSFTRLHIGSLAFRPALLLFGNSRPCVTATPLPHATGAHGQLPGRDFNPLDLLLLLRTVKSCIHTSHIASPLGSPSRNALQRSLRWHAWCNHPRRKRRTSHRCGRGVPPCNSLAV